MPRIDRLASAALLAGLCGCNDANPPGPIAPVAAAQPASDREIVESDARALFDALYRHGDVDSLLGRAHPRLIQAAGGEAAARDGFREWISDIQTARLRVESFMLRGDPTFFASKYTEFVVVPTRGIFKLPDGRRIDCRSFQLGARRKGTAEWRYVEGSRIDEELLDTLFPDFPADVQLPAYSENDL